MNQKIPIVFATNNLKKLKEASSILNTEILGIKDIGIKDFNPIENGKSFRENAVIKVKALQESLAKSKKLDKYLLLADDSGLCVTKLDLKPGIYSARFSNMLKNIDSLENSSDADNRQALKQELKKMQIWGSTGFFECAIAYIFNDGKVKAGVTKGVCDGIITTLEKGDNGFGYDNMFYPFVTFPYNFSDKTNITKFNMNEMSIANLSSIEKNLISHRGKALSELKRELKDFFESLEIDSFDIFN